MWFLTPGLQVFFTKFLMVIVKIFKCMLIENGTITLSSTWSLKVNILLKLNHGQSIQTV